MQLSQLQRQLIGTFFEESTEGLERLESALLSFGEAQADEERIHELFRVVHNMKGGAGTFAMAPLTELAHAMETVLDHLRGGSLAASADVARVLLEGVDACRGMLEEAKVGKALDSSSTAALRDRLQALVPAAGASAPSAPSSSAAAASAGRRTFDIVFAPKPEILETGNEPIRILREVTRLGEAQVQADLSRLPPLGEMDPGLVYLSWQITLDTEASEAQVREVFSWVEDDAEITISVREPSVASAPEAQKAKASEARVGDAGGQGSIRVAVDKIDLLMNMVGELVITQSMLGELDADGPVDTKRLERLRQGLSSLARNTRSIQESVMRLRSMPISVVLNRFPRLVHDLSEKLGKQVELQLNGQTTEIDKTILEKIGDPLVHLVRNSLDHGLETPAERRAAGKAETGVLRVDAYHQGGDIIVQVSDDGRGIARDRVLKRAREVGLVRADEEPSDEAVRHLIFAPGFSTAAAVTDISGRGVGMDAVLQGVRSLGGDVSIASSVGKGTRITLRLPLTLAIIDGQLVRIGEHLYVVPLLSIVESVEIDPGRVSPYQHGTSLYRLRDDFIPMVNPAALLGAGDGEHNQRLMVVVEADKDRVGLLVDELLAQQQVVVKSLESNYGRVDGLAGATVVGEGSVSLILDVAGLSRMAREHRAHAA